MTDTTVSTNDNNSNSQHAIEPPSGGADMLGQATAIEQARAVAEVQGAIIVAQRVPRNVSDATRQLRESCSQKGLADRAFFRYNRGGSAVSGATVHLAREVARCWGNMQYGLVELSRDDTKGESQMLAFAWDVQTNTRATTTFIVKHGRDTTARGIVKLTDLRDIYENNANMGARRLREQIFAIVPKWFSELAQEICTETIRSDGGSGKPLAQRIAEAMTVFGKIGVSVDQLEQRLGREQRRWTENDVAQLGVTYTSISRGEITVDDEFPSKRVSVDEIDAQQKPKTKAAKSSTPASGPNVNTDADQCPQCGAKTGEEHDDEFHHVAGTLL